MTPEPLRLRPFLKQSTPAPPLFSKFVKFPAGVHGDTPAPVRDGVTLFRLRLLFLAV